MQCTVYCCMSWVLNWGLPVMCIVFYGVRSCTCRFHFSEYYVHYFSFSALMDGLRIFILFWLIKNPSKSNEIARSVFIRDLDYNHFVEAKSFRKVVLCRWTSIKANLWSNSGSAISPIQIQAAFKPTSIIFDSESLLFLTSRRRLLSNAFLVKESVFVFR